MSKGRKRKLLAAVVICGSGIAFQALPTGCADYMAAQALSAFDFCSVFNCTGGTFFNFCEPVRLLVDCPQPTSE